MSEPVNCTRPAATAVGPTGGGGTRAANRGPDRLTVALLALASLLLVVALLAGGLGRGRSATVPARPTIMRRIYQTTVVERVLPAAGAASSSAPAVTQTASAPVTAETPPAPAPAPLPVTRTS